MLAMIAPPYAVSLDYGTIRLQSKQGPPASSALDILPAMAVLQVVQEQFEAERPAGRMHSL